jgi:hypothetical protein
MIDLGRRRMDIAAWLRGLGLDRYEPALRDNEIDWAVLPKLTADDLKDIGVTAVGHRRKLLEAIAQLSATDMPPDAVPPIAPRRSGGRTSFVRLKKASSEPRRRLH